MWSEWPESRERRSLCYDPSCPERPSTEVLKQECRQSALESASPKRVTEESAEKLLRASSFIATCALSGLCRHCASLAIPHRTRVAAIPSVSQVHLEHTNRSGSVPNESEREIALFDTLSRPIPDYEQ